MTAIFIIAAAVLLVLLAVFVLIQLKTRWYWRLISTAVVVFAVGRICYVVGRGSESVVLAEYGRSSRDFVEIVDQLAIQGHTNDVHQVCQKYLSVYVTKMSDLTNLDTVIQNAADRVTPQTFKLQTLQKP